MFFSSRNRGRPVLIADIDSGCVGIAVVVLGSSAPHVVTYLKKTLPLESRAVEQTATGIIGLLTECVAQLIKNYSESESGRAYGPIASVYAIVGVPWVHSRTVHGTANYPEPHAITNDMIQRLAKQALQESSPLNAAHVFETNVTRVHLNGYATSKPLGKHAKSASVTVMQSDINPMIRSGIEHAFSSALPGRSLTIRSRIRSLLAVLHEHMSSSSNYVVVTMGNDATSCVAVRKEEIAEQEVVPEGIATISRRVAGDTGLPEELGSVMRMIAADSCTTPGCEAAKTGIARAEPELVRAFGEAFSRLALHRRLPNRCIISADDRFEPWLAQFFERIDFSQFTITAQVFSVEPLDSKQLTEAVTWEPGIHEDIGLTVAAAFVNIR